MPKETDVKLFCQIISDHLENNPQGIIGVHCTHGLNRTGYFICRYMIDCLGISGPTSVNSFEKARGHRFDRENYREFLMERNPHNSIDNEYSYDKGKDSQSNRHSFSQTSKKSINTDHSDWRKRQEKSYFSGQDSYRKSDSYYDGRDGYGDSPKNCHNLKRPHHRDVPDNRELDWTRPGSSINRTSFDNTNFSDYRSYKLSKERSLVDLQQNWRKSNDKSNRDNRTNKYPKTETPR